jgi:hypothetical protein
MVALHSAVFDSITYGHTSVLHPHMRTATGWDAIPADPFTARLTVSPQSTCRSYCEVCAGLKSAVHAANPRQKKCRCSAERRRINECETASYAGVSSTTLGCSLLGTRAKPAAGASFARRLARLRLVSSTATRPPGCSSGRSCRSLLSVACMDNDPDQISDGHPYTVTRVVVTIYRAR